MKCAVITPVGPGHADLYRECLQSIRDAVDHDRGPFDEIVPLALDDAEGKHGRSARRN